VGLGVKRLDGALRLTMSTEIRMKDESGDEMRGFAIAGEDRRFHPAVVRCLGDGVDARKQPVLRKNVLVLASRLVPEPVHYRYALVSPWEERKTSELQKAWTTERR
jgi:sialate O-acetylesterase